MIKFTKQLPVYNDTKKYKQKLINWLKDDLKEQRVVISKEKGIDKSEVKDEELTLNIGHQNQKIIINFDFNFWKIFSDLLGKQTDKYDCPYKVNCMNVIFQGKVNLGIFKSNGVSNLDIPQLNYLGDIGQPIFENLVNCDAQKSNNVIHFGIFTFKESVNFSNSTFEGLVNLGTSKFEKTADFSNSTFKGTADFSASTFKGTADFSASTFKGSANFKSINFIENVSFEKATFEKKVNFERAIFEKEADFKYVVFNETANFTFTIFKGEADFKWAKVKKNIIFNNTSLYERGAFWEIEIDNETLTFDNIKLSDKSNIYFGGVVNTETTIEIKNTVINGHIDFNDLEIKEINFEKSIVVGNGVVTRIRFETECNNSQTARLLKHEAYKASNVIEGLKYKAIEKNLYAKELYEKKDKNTQTWAVIASIKLSKLSNNHGQDWFRAVLFTIVSGLLFFTLSIIPIIFTYHLCISFIICYIALMYWSISNKIWKCIIFVCFLPFLFIIILYLYETISSNIKLYIDNFFAYLIPTNFDGIIQNKSQNFINTFFMSGKKINTTYSLFQSLDGIEKIFSYTTYFMGKIAIGYGMVEIVQAFRKLNSK